MRIQWLLPFLLLSALLGFLYRALFYTQPTVLPSALIGEMLPAFSLPTLFAPEKKLTDHDFKGRVRLLNVWATWCEACRMEHAMLMKIRQDYQVPIYGINYKDNPGDAKQWLKQYGNPYTVIGNDAYGDVAIELGIYGTPETFVVNAEGRIIYRHVGAIDQNAWERVLYPLVKGA